MKIKLTDISEVIDKVEDIFFSEDKKYKKVFIYKFIPIQAE